MVSAEEAQRTIGCIWQLQNDLVEVHACRVVVQRPHRQRVTSRHRAERLHAFGDDLADAHARVERGVGILEHHLHALAQRFPVANLPDVLIRYELDPGGISLSRRRRQLLARLKVQGRHAGASPMAWLGMARTLTLLALPYGLVFSLKSRLRRGARAG